MINVSFSRCFLDDVRYLFFREERLAGIKPLYFQCLSVVRHSEAYNLAQNVIADFLVGLNFNVQCHTDFFTMLNSSFALLIALAVSASNS